MHRSIIVVSCLLAVAAASGVAQENEPKRPYSIEFLSATEGSAVLIGEADDEFFARMHPREAAAMTGTPREDKSRAESQTFTREFFRKAVLEFNDEEKSALRLITHRISTLFGKEYPLLIHRPWRFVKTRKDLCGGFSFTRADCIVLSERTLKRIVRTIQQSESTSFPEQLLLHEQIHVLQREQPELFRMLYEQQFGFKAATVKMHPWIDERQVTNPDGVSDDWIVQVKKNDTTSAFWVGTILREEKALHRMGRDFSTVVVPVVKDDDGYRMVLDEATQLPELLSQDDIPQLKQQLPMRSGYDHPNEVAAYLFTGITHDSSLNEEEVAPFVAEAKEWFQKNLIKQEN